MSSVQLTVSTDFGYVMVSAAVIALESVVIGGGVMGLRKELFAGEEFEKRMEASGLMDEHKKAFPEQPKGPLLGYPDMGSGRYAALLPYDKWVQFNNAQRAHHNMLEQVPSVLTALVLAGIRFPKVAAALGIVYAIGRIMYSRGYKSKKGAKGREAGAILSALCMMSLIGTTIYSGASLALSN